MHSSWYTVSPYPSLWPCAMAMPEHLYLYIKPLKHESMPETSRDMRYTNSLTPSPTAANRVANVRHFHKLYIINPLYLPTALPPLLHPLLPSLPASPPFPPPPPLLIPFPPRPLTNPPQPTPSPQTPKPTTPISPAFRKQQPPFATWVVRRTNSCGSVGECVRVGI